MKYQARTFFAKSTIAAAALCLMACGTEVSDNSQDDPELYPSDYPEVPVSDDCGGKCDSPDALLNVAQNRLISSLEMYDYVTADGEEEIFNLRANLTEEQAELVELGQTLSLSLYAADGASNPDFRIDGELVYTEVEGEDGVESMFVSDVIDSSLLLPWQLLRIEVKGDHAGREIFQTFEFGAGLENGAEILPEPEPEADPFAQAYEVNLPLIYISPDAETPDYERASVDNFGLGGTEFWQRWPGGENPTFSYTKGSEAGRKCMYASARRFQTIMENPPESIVKLKEETNWSGRFFNWNDDFSHEESSRNPSGPVLWAWRTSLVKWISQTGDDGACFLPTLDMVERAAENCLDKAESNGDGEIEGCQAY